MHDWCQEQKREGEVCVSRSWNMKSLGGVGMSICLSNHLVDCCAVGGSEPFFGQVDSGSNRSRSIGPFT
jgi:hypothetical protein